MKSILNRYRVALAALLVVAAHTVSNAATPVSPVFTNGVLGWDCLISGAGSERGIIFLTFNENGTFTGKKINCRVANPKDSADRGGIPSDRDPASPPTSVTNLYGFTDIKDGSWRFDADGYTIGFFTSLVATEAELLTNQFSFRAKITPNKRFTASFSGGLGGNGTYRGVPMKSVTSTKSGADLAGNWSGEEINGGFTTFEFFSLAASASYPNLYDVDGGYGPGYSLIGHCMVSSQKRIAFANLKNSTLRAAVGSSVNKSTSLGGTMKGQTDGATNIITYKAFWLSPSVVE